ncbi:MAG: hypothetical protein KKA62_04185 [Nanoarchaeota archaeon]|nr:hypothetical protein [Nanoarchaeota archaeon]MBU1644527.1 hypothetical protein [Nanoarchaeota archaeon]MBU1977121.1 hypothetical protein [Nanoarchaeota archaeon]
MGELITFEEKAVIVKGLDRLALPDEDKVKNQFFSEEYSLLLQLKDSCNLTLTKKKPTLFYPGCGSDILTPLIYLESLFPQTTEADLIFNDENNTFGLIKTILDEVGVSFQEQDNHLCFYWKNILIHLEFIQGDAFSLIREIPPFEIYFEKAFRIMKSYHQDFEDLVYEKLAEKGILISDSGFQDKDLKKVPVPEALSSYQEMIIGIKN